MSILDEDEIIKSLTKSEMEAFMQKLQKSKLKLGNKTLSAKANKTTNITKIKKHQIQRVNLTKEKYDNKKAVLLIGGIDPTGGAGLVRDAIMVQKAGCHPLCVPTCLAVQNNSEYVMTQGVAPEVVEMSLSLLIKEIANIGAIKIGMVPRVEHARVIAKFVKQTGLKTIVDMPLISSTGAFLSDIENIEEVCVLLLTDCYLYTPNKPECEMLGGAREILSNSVTNILVKGGHDESNPEWADDTLITLEERIGDDYKYKQVKLRSKRIDTDGMDVRGTGCSLASAIAAYTAKDFELKEAILKAKELLLASFKKSYYLGGGAKFLG